MYKTRYYSLLKKNNNGVHLPPYKHQLRGQANRNWTGNRTPSSLITPLAVVGEYYLKAIDIIAPLYQARIGENAFTGIDIIPA
jgi:hypothetical protein